jgi:hypothetical protein
MHAAARHPRGPTPVEIIINGDTRTRIRCRIAGTLGNCTVNHLFLPAREYGCCNRSALCNNEQYGLLVSHTLIA